ncbi:MAG: LysR family transcriptional regulator, partial [Nitratireductor sp.]
MRHTLPLQYLDAVARAGSIRSAAQDLSITPSALNRRILAMEHELGVELFERHTNGVYLNSAGELFIQHVRNQMADLERVKSRIADLSGLRLGKVKIAATHEASRYFLPNEIAIYRKEFPGVSFQVNGMSRSVVADQLATYEADLIVVFQPDKLADVHTLIQAKQDMMCVVST